MPRGEGQGSSSYIAGAAQRPMGCWLALAFSFAITLGGELLGQEKQEETIRIFEKDEDQPEEADHKEAGINT